MMHSDNEPKENLVGRESDPLIHRLNQVVVFTVKVLATLMVFVIMWSLVDVLVHIYREIFDTPFVIEDLFNMLGSFLAVLIAIEIFLNIVFYLKKDAIHVPLVLSTALTAVARKVIILDYQAVSPDHIFGLAAIILAVGITYWLVTKKSFEVESKEN